MATLKLYSSSDMFSFVIRKNPSSGMIAKNIRKGTAFGWFADSHTYCVAFFDGIEEMSFAKRRNQEFAFLDRTRYNAPLFLSVAIREFFQTALKKRNEEQDIEGGNCFLEISSVEIGRAGIFQKIKDCFPGFEIEARSLQTGTETVDYSLKISTERKTLHELLNLGYLMGYLLATCCHVEFQVEQSILQRLIEACNLLEAPYYVRNLIRGGCIHSLEDFRKVENTINGDDGLIKMSPYSNASARFQWVRNQLPRDMDILDFGCGEGRFFSLSARIPSSTYYAVDRDESAREQAKKTALRRELENVIVLEDLDSFLQLDTGREFLVIMSEVFEHNEPGAIRGELQKLMAYPYCSQILLSTPNRDFNANYLLQGGELRHEGHVFEMTAEEVKDYFSKLVQGTEFSFVISKLGDEVDGVSSTLAVTMTRTGRKGEVE